MKRAAIIIGLLIVTSVVPSLNYAIETTPRITDREIIERLTRLEEGQKGLGKRIDDLRSEMNGKFTDLRSEMNGKFADLRSAMNNRFEEVNNRFDTLQWMLGLFITIALVILGFVLRMQWQMQRRQTHMETTLETQKDELAFIKGLVEKLLPPRGAL